MRAGSGVGASKDPSWGPAYKTSAGLRNIIHHATLAQDSNRQEAQQVAGEKTSMELISDIFLFEPQVKHMFIPSIMLYPRKVAVLKCNISSTISQLFMLIS